MQVKLHKKSIHLVEAFDWAIVDLVRGFPDRRKFNDRLRAWVIEPSLRNLEYLEATFPNAEWDQDARDFYEKKMARKADREAILARAVSGNVNGIPFAFPPFKHQETALLLGRDKESFAYFMDQGTGKTKVLIDDACHNFREGRIKCLIVICPNSVKTNWKSQVEMHMPPDINYYTSVWYSGAKKKDVEERERWRNHISWGELLVVVINVDAVRTKKLMDFITPIVSELDCMIAVDESTRIKNPGAARTKKATQIRKNCKLARILTGTPIIKSPLDSFAQLRFLDPDILGFSSFYAFRNRYAIMGGYGNHQVFSYKNLEELQERIKSTSYRVEKEECLDLPPKMYDKREIVMTAAQDAAYKEMCEEALLYLSKYTSEEGIVTAPIKLTVLLRLQQITSGFLPVTNEAGETIDNVFIKDKSPKIQEALRIIEECNHKVIVFGRFKPELYALHEQLGGESVIFTGDQPDSERVEAREMFQDVNSNIRVFIAQVQTGGIGIDLYRGRTVIYLSNSFGTEDRVQSEDRAHRIGQEHSVQYIDLVVKGSVDELIIDTLRSNKNLSAILMEDKENSWI